MKEIIFEIIKWAFILIIAGFVFYVVSPKYAALEGYGRISTISGEMDYWDTKKKIKNGLECQNKNYEVRLLLLQS